MQDDYITKTIKAYDSAPDKFVSATDVMVNELEMKTMLKYLPSNDAMILDIGCGSGKDMQHLADWGYHVKGVDLSSGLLEKAKQLHPQLDFRQMDVRHLNFPDESFGAVWCNAVLLHLNEKDLKTALAEICRILVTGGILAVSFKGGEGSREVVETFSTDLARFYTFKTVETLNEMLTSAGFVIKENTRLNERERFGPDKRDLSWVWAFAVKPS